MVYNEKGEVLVMNRLKQDWPGLNFPGGHVKPKESLSMSVIREMKEETGLDISNVEQVGVYEWNLSEEGVRHLVILYRTNTYTGELKSSREGPVFFVKPSSFSQYPLSTDFLSLYQILSHNLILKK
jgi:8-oxo-dGTP diphosphatase